jgi:hypothetical protein
VSTAKVETEEVVEVKEAAPSPGPLHDWKKGVMTIEGPILTYALLLFFGPQFTTDWRLVIAAIGFVPGLVLLTLYRTKIQGEVGWIPRDELNPLSLLALALSTAGLVTAVSLTIVPAMAQSTGPWALPVDRWLLLVIFLAVAIPFYHSGPLYLQRRWVAGERRTLFDFVFVLVEGSMLLVLASSTANLGFFVVWLLAIFGVHAAWLAYALTDGRENPPPATWLWLNLSMIVFLTTSAYFGFAASTLDFLLVLSIVTIGRTVVDYIVAWPLYLATKST